MRVIDQLATRAIESGSVDATFKNAIRELRGLKAVGASWIGGGRTMQVRFTTGKSVTRLSVGEWCVNTMVQSMNGVNVSAREHAVNETVEFLFDKIVVGLLETSEVEEVHRMARETVTNKFLQDDAPLHSSWNLVRNDDFGKLPIIQEFRAALTDASLVILEAARQEAMKDGASTKKASLEKGTIIRKHRDRLKKAIWPAILEGFPEEEMHTLVREAIVEATLRS